ncbi:hypothetical protein LZD49_00470 [Dyadobacter sp. CY261]|uniref:energy transducer TonB n=1 Tax=Dyadobacter sp. CY261 TaxID=2907203 RepID=UPI001F40A831|nr:energy transducer TonB [Dyadobacter sp. CY261]MCF0068921.1 hypothetical protein [Dyadobacter sp. CY261]
MATTNDLIPDFDDFERYYSGRMPSAQQRLLEGRMLDEPLVAGAYEGFLLWRAEHLDVAGVRTDLYRRLNERVPDLRVPDLRVPDSRRRILPLWMYASAASVCLAIIFYWLVFLRDYQGDMRQPPATFTQKKSAVSEQTPTLNLPAPAPAAIKPTGTPTTGAPSRLVLKSIPGSLPPANVPSGTKQSADVSVESRAVAPVVSTEAEESVRKDEFGVALADSGLAQTAPSQAAIEPGKALAVPGSAQAVGKSLAARAKATSSQPHLVSKKATDTNSNALPETLNEVLIAGTSTQAKRTNVPIPSDVDRPAPVPAGGWEPYRAYLDSSTGSAIATGQVVVTFVVSPTGTLIGFTAKGISELQNEAIQIIRKGPAWLPARTKGGPVAAIAEIRLQFRRTH